MQLASKWLTPLLVEKVVCQRGSPVTPAEAHLLEFSPGLLLKRRLSMCTQVMSEGFFF